MDPAVDSCSSSAAPHREILNFVLHYIYSTAGVSYFTDNVIVYRHHECIKYNVLLQVHLRYHNKAADTVLYSN